MAPRPSRLAAFRSRLLVALGLVVALTVVGYVAVNLLVSAELGSVARVQVNVAPAPSDGANYLLIGSDTRAFVQTPEDKQHFGDQSDAGGNRSDTIMVLHVYPGSTRALLVSFPRDLWVDVPGRGMSKINAAFNDGPQKVIDTLQSNFNVPVNHYVEVNFDTFRRIVDAIGTVPVYFPAPARDTLTGLNIPVAGCAHLDGPSALAFVRSRHLELQDPANGRWRDADPVPDIGRIARQQALLRELGKVAMDAALLDPLSAPDIVDGAIAKLKLDEDFGRRDLFALVAAFHSEPGDASSLESQTLPWTAGTAGGQSVLFPKKPDAEALLARLRDFSSPPPESPSAAASPGDVFVRVLNGSGVDGAAARALKALQTQGFEGAGTGNADGRATSSKVHYGSGNEAAAHLVAAYVGGGVKLVADASVHDADVVLVIGSQFTGVVAPAATPQPAPSGSAPSGAPPAQTGSLAPVPGDC